MYPETAQRSVRHALVLGVAFNSTGQLLAAASADRHAYLWSIANPANPQQLGQLGGFTNYVYNVAFSPDNHTMAVSSADHTTRLWDITNTGHPTPLGGPLTGPTDYDLAVAFSPDGTMLAVASNDRTVWLYNVRDPHHPSTVATLHAVGGNVNTVTFSPNGRTLAAGGRANKLALWDVDPQAYAQRLCRDAGDPITPAEWHQYVPGTAYSPPCGS
jgi:WD40 repeat protein